MGVSGKARVALVGAAVAVSVAAGAALTATWDGGQLRVRDWLRQLGSPACVSDSPSVTPALAPKRSAGWRLEYQHDGTLTSLVGDVGGSGPGNMWATGYQGSDVEDHALVLRRQDSEWSEVPTPSAYRLTSAHDVAETAAGAWVLAGSETTGP